MMMKNPADLTDKKILVVDAEPAMLLFYEEMLGGEHEILTASHGIRALEILRLIPVDIAFVDIHLPDISGIDVLKEIKSVDSSIPVIIVTGYGDEDSAVASFRAGAEDYFKKPFGYEVLRKIVYFYLSLKLENKINRKPDFADRNPALHSRLSDISSTHYLSIQKALKFINDKFMENIDLDTVANQVNLSKSYFSRLFKKCMNICYQDYLNNIRIEKAKELMLNNNLSITDVALKVGYNDITHFGRTFRKLVGNSPRQYVKNSRKTSSQKYHAENRGRRAHFSLKFRHGFSS